MKTQDITALPRLSIGLKGILQAEELRVFPRKIKKAGIAHAVRLEASVIHEFNKMAITTAFGD